MKKLDIQYDLKPNGAVIRINNYSGCIFRICRIPKELVFDENGNVKEFIDLAYSQSKVIKEDLENDISECRENDSYITDSGIYL
jgi:hypothetical protein